jgi:hypothetical protein
MDFGMGLVIGLLVGATAGFFVLALMVVAKENGRDR